MKELKERIIYTLVYTIIWITIIILLFKFGILENIKLIILIALISLSTGIITIAITHMLSKEMITAMSLVFVLICILALSYPKIQPMMIQSAYNTEGIRIKCDNPEIRSDLNTGVDFEGNIEWYEFENIIKVYYMCPLILDDYKRNVYLVSLYRSSNVKDVRVICDENDYWFELKIDNVWIPIENEDILYYKYHYHKLGEVGFNDEYVWLFKLSK